MNEKLLLVSTVLLITILFTSNATAWEIPEGLEAISGEDGSVWVRVNQPGFGSNDNMSVVAMTEYGERLYAMTRNEATGAEVWRTSGTGWEQITFPGLKANLNNVWGKMIVFEGKLYCGFSSGLQGSSLGSVGCEIWRYDGMNWEAVISDSKDIEESGTITAISGCLASDGDTTAQITDGSKTWTGDEWAGGILQITSGDGMYRKFNIISNTPDTLTIQQNEKSGNEGTEYTICAETTYNNPYPVYSYTLGEIQTGDSYEIGMGDDENGFGAFWNKTITDMVIFDSKLYVSTGLNYEYGAQVWFTTDGDNWTVTQPTNSFGNFHPADSSWPNSQKPVSTSITNLCESSVSGSPVLYAGGTGSSGDAGSCSRMAKLTGEGWELIVDVNVDENNVGTNENGFGDGMDCDMNTGNFMPWSLADFGGKLIAGINSLGGARVLYSTNGSSEDGNWLYSVGGDSGIPNGFDGLLNGGMTTTYQNIAVNLFPFGDYIYAGIISLFVPEYGATEEYLTGSHIWKSDNGTAWEQVTGNGLGDTQIVMFEAFTTLNSALYASGSKGASSTPQGLAGAKVFRLASTLADTDGDGVLNNEDNCPTTPNGSALGTCVKMVSSVLMGTGVPCTSSGNECGSGETCQMLQGDDNINDIGDACECYANIDDDLETGLFDLIIIKNEYGSSGCTPADQENCCKADLDGDGEVGLFDLIIMKTQYGKSDCPASIPPCTLP